MIEININTLSQVNLYVPSIPDASMQLVSILVKRKGTISGNLERCEVISKQSPKSI
jgi:hypothetical protein